MYGYISPAKQISAKCVWLSWRQPHTRHKVTQERWFKGKPHKSQHAGLEGTWKTVCFQPYIHLRLHLIWNGYTNLRNTFGFQQSVGPCTGVNLEMAEPPYWSRSFPQVAYNLQLAPPPKPNKTSKTLPRLGKRTWQAGCSLSAALRLCWRGRARMVRPSRAYINRPLLAGSRRGKAKGFSVLSLRGMEWPQPERIFLSAKLSTLAALEMEFGSLSSLCPRPQSILHDTESVHPSTGVPSHPQQPGPTPGCYPRQ